MAYECTPCAKGFDLKTNLERHETSKAHKKRLAVVQSQPKTNFAEDIAALKEQNAALMKQGAEQGAALVALGESHKMLQAEVANMRVRHDLEIAAEHAVEIALFNREPLRQIADREPPAPVPAAEPDREPPAPEAAPAVAEAAPAEVAPKPVLSVQRLKFEADKRRLQALSERDDGNMKVAKFFQKREVNNDDPKEHSDYFKNEFAEYEKGPKRRLAQKRQCLEGLVSEYEEKKQEIIAGYTANLPQMIAAYKQGKPNAKPEKLEAKIKVLTEDNEKEKNRALKRYMEDEDMCERIKKAKEDVQYLEPVVSIYESARHKYFKTDAVQEPDGQEPDEQEPAVYSHELSEEWPDGWS